MIFSEIIVYATFAYLGIGVLFALWFAAFGVTKFDEAAKETSVGFRLIIFFGAVAFWVLLAWRLRTNPKSETRNRNDSQDSQNT